MTVSEQLSRALDSAGVSAAPGPGVLVLNEDGQHREYPLAAGDKIIRLDSGAIVIFRVNTK